MPSLMRGRRRQSIFNLEIVPQNVSHQRAVVSQLRMVLLKVFTEIMIGSPEVECFREGVDQSERGRLALISVAFEQAERNHNQIGEEKEEN